MSADIEVKQNERRVVRVFTLDLPAEQIRFLRDTPDAIADLLQTHDLDTAHLDLIRLADLDELGLSGYLVEGCGVAESEVAKDKTKLDTLDGFVLVVLSRAFKDKAHRLSPKQGVTLFATYGQLSTDWSEPEKLASNSALPHSAQRVSPRQARADARRTGAAVFVVFMIAIALLLWAVLT